MRDPYDPTLFRGGAGNTLPTAHFIDTSGFGVVPFRVTNPGVPSPGASRHPLPRAGEGKGEEPARHPAIRPQVSRPSSLESLHRSDSAFGRSEVPLAGEGESEGEPPTLDALRATIDAIAHDARWRGPPREMPLSERMAGRRTVARLNAAIADIEARLAEDPPSERRTIRLTAVRTGVLVTLDDLRPALAMAGRALRWLEERRHWREARASWGER